jgi:uncharacterized protein YoxC
MECIDVQEKLSAYVEGIISPEERTLLDEHLTLCQKCCESLADLKKTVEYIHNLEDVEPPTWLTQKVMARIRSEAKSNKGLLQKLFYPLHIKLPIEAVAVIVIAVTALYIFKTIQPVVRLAKIPSEEVTTQSPPREIDTFQKNLKSKENVIPPPPPLEKGGKGGFEAEEPIPSKKPETEEKYQEAPKAPTPVVKQDEIRPSAGAIAKDESKTEVLSRVPKALSERKGKIINLTINVKDIETATKEIEKDFSQLGGRIIKTESFENKDIITAELNSNKLKELFEKLNRLGEIKEKETDLKVLEGDVSITIEIIKITTQP